MRKFTKILLMLAVAILVVSVGSFAKMGGKIVVGFSQIGSESEWRNADTVSVQNSFNEDT